MHIYFHDGYLEKSLRETVGISKCYLRVVGSSLNGKPIYATGCDMLGIFIPETESLKVKSASLDSTDLAVFDKDNSGFMETLMNKSMGHKDDNHYIMIFELEVYDPYDYYDSDNEYFWGSTNFTYQSRQLKITDNFLEKLKKRYH